MYYVRPQIQSKLFWKRAEHRVKYYAVLSVLSGIKSFTSVLFYNMDEFCPAIVGAALEATRFEEIRQV